MKKIMVLAVGSMISTFTFPQSQPVPPVKDIIANIQRVCPDAGDSLAIMRQILTQEKQTGSAFFGAKVGPVKGQAWTAMHDFVSIQATACLISKRKSDPSFG